MKQVNKEYDMRERTFKEDGDRLRNVKFLDCKRIRAINECRCHDMVIVGRSSCGSCGNEITPFALVDAVIKV